MRQQRFGIQQTQPGRVSDRRTSGRGERAVPQVERFQQVAQGPRPVAQKLRFLARLGQVRADGPTGIGRMRERKVHAFGSETALEFADILEEVNTEHLIVDAHGDGYGPSDHTPFFAKDISVLHFFTGAHPQYHKTTDDYDRIETAGLGEVTRLVARAARLIADADKAPTFNRPKRSSPHGDPRDSVGRSRGYGAYFGSIPDFTERKEAGVRLTGVRKDSPASKAGVRAGDIVRVFGGVEVKNLYDFTFALRQHRPGDEVDVQIERDGKLLDVKAVLGKRGH